MIKEKLDNFNIKGHVKVSLFEDGKLVKEVEKDNFITEFGKDYLRIVNARTVGGGLSPLSNRLEWFGNRSNYALSTFSKLLLSDSDIPEDPLNDKFLWGNNIGWADRAGTYSGPDDRRGSINMSESYVGGNRTHLVFDFPTHSANGIIRSLGFVNSSEYVEGMFRILDCFDGDIFFHSTTNKGRYAYCSASNIRLNKVNLDDFTSELITLPSNNYGVVNLNGSLYMSTGRNIFKMTPDETGVTDEKLNLDIVFNNNSKICSLGNKLYLVTLDGTVDDLKGVPKNELLYIFNADGSLVESVELPSYFGSISKPLVPISKGILCVNGYIYDVNLKSFMTSHSSYSSCIYDELNDRSYWTARIGYENYICLLYPSSLASKVVLPIPIEKTEKQTMKIEYDFLY